MNINFLSVNFRKKGQRLTCLCARHESTLHTLQTKLTLYEKNEYILRFRYLWPDVKIEESEWNPDRDSRLEEVFPANVSKNIKPHIFWYPYSFNFHLEIAVILRIHFSNHSLSLKLSIHFSKTITPKGVDQKWNEIHWEFSGGNQPITNYYRF